MGEAVAPTAFCLEIVSLGTDQKYSENCFTSHSSLNLNEVSPGGYRLTAYLRRFQPPDHPVIASSVQNIDFEVRTASSPTDIGLAGRPQTERLIGVANPESDLATVQLSLHWNGLPELFSSFETCVSLEGTGSPTAVMLSESCFPHTEQAITLSKLPLGHYKLQSVLRTKKKVVLDESRRSYDLNIVPLEEAYPTLSLVESSAVVMQHAQHGSNKYELAYAADGTAGYGKVEIEVAVSDAVAGAAELVVACMELLGADGSRLAENTCLKPSQRVFSVAQLPVGTYTAVFTLHPVHAAGATHVPNRFAAAVTHSRVVAHVEVGRPEELIPSYDWQPLKPWYTVPAGLEIRLPIGSGAAMGEAIDSSRASPRKEARIPEPWRLQVELPRPPCRPYFLRMDVTRDTTIAQIRAEAARQCKVPEGCMSVLAGGRELSPQDTMETAQFFSAVKLIHYDGNCDAESH